MVPVVAVVVVVVVVAVIVVRRGDFYLHQFLYFSMMDPLLVP